MASFHYTARTATGSLQQGSITAPDRASAFKALTQHKLTPVLIKEAQPHGLHRLKLPGFGSKVKGRDLVIMTRQLATMVNAGVPLVRCLETLNQQTQSANLKKALAAIVAKVEDGAPLSEALAAHPKVFSVVFINMVKAGETGGILDQILDRLAFQMEKDHAIRGKVKGALIYPGVIMSATFGAFYFLMTGIVPKLKEIFDQFGGQLPIHTRLMLATSGFLQKYGWLVMLLGIGGIILLVRLTRRPKGRKIWHRLILRLPIFGNIVRKVNVARFARTFSSLTSAGVPVLDGLTVTAQALKNVVISQGIMAATEKVKNGQPISASLEESRIFPDMVWQMIAVGEETGEVDKVLGKVADFYEEEIDRVVGSLTSVLEPLLIIFLGGLVGLIIASVFGPISSLSNIVE
ncbi:type II secretion system F family protein [Candidatus Microgenomates bacterium]|nr:type II secretion system F family protein [Candidatus Microgenomates bacterium]